MGMKLRTSKDQSTIKQPCVNQCYIPL